MCPAAGIGCRTHRNTHHTGRPVFESRQDFFVQLTRKLTRQHFVLKVQFGPFGKSRLVNDAARKFVQCFFFCVKTFLYVNFDGLYVKLSDDLTYSGRPGVGGRKQSKEYHFHYIGRVCTCDDQQSQRPKPTLKSFELPGD